MSSEDFIELRGVTLPIACVRFALALEDRGWSFKRVGEKLSVTYSETNRTSGGQVPDNADKLTDEDVLAIKKWRDHLLVVVDL